MMSPKLVEGGLHADGRGILRFCNDFNMSPVKRFYTIANSAEQPVRGWIGHKKETKWFFPLKGCTVIAVESMNHNHIGQAKSSVTAATCSSCSVRLKIFTLDSTHPSVLKLPPGNWFCIEQAQGAEVMVFSDCMIGEYEDDDFRRPL